MMEYPSAGSTSSTIYVPAVSPIQMQVPFCPVTFWPMTVPPVPLVPPRKRSWKVQPGRASWVTLS